MKRTTSGSVRCGLLAGVIVAAMTSGNGLAAPLPIYQGPAINLASPACLTYGDGVGCSLGLLNYLAGFDPNATTPGGYKIDTPQGALAPYIVLQAGGNAGENGDLTNPLVENGFKSNDGGSDSFRATGQTSTIAGNMNNPANNQLVSGLGANADLPGTWDVGLAWLINALTPDTVRRQLMIGFDYNQPQNAVTSLDYWALITVRDLDGLLTDTNFEFRSPTGLSTDAFSTTKTIDSKPSSSDFATVYGKTCVDSTNTMVPAILPITGGACPAGYDITIDNAQSTSTTEIVGFVPRLSAGLENFLAQGYDVISVRMAFGCFGGTPQGSFQPGVGYLSNGGATSNCEGGGFADVFLMAGSPERQQLPEPPALALIALATLGLLGTRIRRRRPD